MDRGQVSRWAVHVFTCSVHIHYPVNYLQYTKGFPESCHLARKIFQVERKGKSEGGSTWCWALLHRTSHSHVILIPGGLNMKAGQCPGQQFNSPPLPQRKPFSLTRVTEKRGKDICSHSQGQWNKVRMSLRQPSLHIPENHVIRGTCTCLDSVVAASEVGGKAWVDGQFLFSGLHQW